MAARARFDLEMAVVKRPRRIAALAERGFTPARGLRFPFARLMTTSLVRDALEEDGAANDLTSIATIVSDRRARCVIIAREAGVIAGIPLAREAFRQRDARASVRAAVRDGQRVNASTPVVFITGHARGLLSAERVALNFLQRLSGIASLTRKYVEAVKGTGVKILDTRKTTPGWRRLEKYAVRAGGGMSHREDLSSAILIKPVEVECNNLDQVRSALISEAEVIMLDNMSDSAMREAVELVNGRAVIEASGGVTLERVRSIAEIGVDWISVGALTHSAEAMDLALEFE